MSALLDRGAKMKYIIIILAVVLISCDDIKQPEPDWRLAPTIYKCTQEEMAKVEHEAKWCNDNTDYIDEYCYGSAIIRNCTKQEIKTK
jgi:hypothetical protein